MNKIVVNFNSPGAEYRGSPFWAWNSKLEPEELRRQIRTFHEMGFGGFFMHSRVGLNTRYLGSEWFDCVKACIDEAKKLGLKAYLYDEDRWPSGAAGSLVTRNDRFKIRFCKYELLTSPEKSTSGGNTLAWFSAQVRGKDDKRKVVAAKRLDNPEQFKPGKNCLLLRFAEVLAQKSPWFNGETYLDTLNPEAVKAFLDSTHEAYYREVGEDFGETVPAIFSDEPCFSHGITEFCMPWTSALPERFREKYHRELLDLLPEIFFVSLAKYSAARLQYMDTITELFVHSFSQQIGDWCDKHHLMMTGHVLLEDSLSQAFFVGSAMRFYEYMQMPGIDLLTEHWEIFNTAKQCSSMAHQFGRSRRLSETYGCTGWDFPFMGHKALGEWQFALGINFRCQHLAWYSAEGEAKRDYPASISYQSPWYGKYAKVENYFARLGAALSQGGEDIDLLVIHPIESAWLGIDFDNYFAPSSERGKAMKALDRRFAQLTNRLLEQKLDFEFGEEEVISRHGSIDQGRFWINKASYRAVLLPQMVTIRATTLRLLEDFADQGGMVVYLGSAPAHVDGYASAEPDKAYARFRHATLGEAIDCLAPVVRRVSVTRPNGRQIEPILTRLSKCGDNYCAFLVNYGEKFSADINGSQMVRDRKLKYPRAQVSLNIPFSGKVYELDPDTGKIYSVEARYVDDHYAIHTSFDCLESHLYLVTSDDVAVSPRPERILPQGFKRHSCPVTTWACTPDEPNLLVMDHAAWSIEGQSRHDNEYILTIDDKVRKLLGQPERGGSMVQPWLRGEVPPKRTIPLRLNYCFDIAEVPTEDCTLAVEHPEYYTFELNGQGISSAVQHWWCDRDIKTIAIPRHLLRQGENSLVLRCDYHENLSGLEAIYLRGNFGVKDDTLTAQPHTLTLGDWTKQGFPYYAGNMTYHGRVTLPEGGARLQIEQWRGGALGIRVNHGAEQLLGWPPFRVELPGGEVDLSITVYSSRRNAMGPFYWHTAWPDWTGSYQFKVKEQQERQLVPCGLISAPTLFY